jgi:hypothetical protein
MCVLNFISDLFLLILSQQVKYAQHSVDVLITINVRIATE